MRQPNPAQHSTAQHSTAQHSSCWCSSPASGCAPARSSRRSSAISPLNTHVHIRAASSTPSLPKLWAIGETGSCTLLALACIAGCVQAAWPSSMTQAWPECMADTPKPAWHQHSRTQPTCRRGAAAGLCSRHGRSCKPPTCSGARADELPRVRGSHSRVKLPTGFLANASRCCTQLHLSCTGWPWPHTLRTHMAVPPKASFACGFAPASSSSCAESRKPFTQLSMSRCGHLRADAGAQSLCNTPALQPSLYISPACCFLTHAP